MFHSLIIIKYFQRIEREVCRLY